MTRRQTGFEGHLDIRLSRQADAITAVDIHSSRPLHVPRLFLGKSLEETLAAVPLIFSLCGTAQSCAAVIAGEQALGIAVPRCRQNGRALLVGMETAQEHLWRTLLDWPVFINERPVAPAVAESGRLHQCFREALFRGSDPFKLGGKPLLTRYSEAQRVLKKLAALVERSVFGQPPEQWLQTTDFNSLEHWARQAGTTPARLLRYVIDSGWNELGRCRIEALPLLPAEQLHQRLAAPDARAFIRAPRWDGEPRETSSLTRQADSALIKALGQRFGNGLLTRLAARLLELARLPGQLAALLEILSEDSEVPTSPHGVGCGLGQVEAARGRLIHRLVLDGETVANYQIVAPTEWNFHPDGVLIRALKTLRGDDALLRKQAALLINAVDPCVRCQIQLH